MTAILVIGVAAVAGLLVAVVKRPSAYHVERTIEVAARPEVVFGILDDLHQFARVLVLFGSPLANSDPGMQKVFEGPATGVGQSFAWSGKKAGKAKLTIVESIPGQTVVMRLEFVAPMKSTATYALTLAGTASGSVVTWSMRGNHNFIGKAFGMVMNMDKMLGADLDKGLAQLRTVAEGS